MSNVSIADAKAPFVRFEKRPVEDRAASEAAGQYVAKDVDFVIITPPGSKDCVERVASEWFAQKEEDVKQGRFERDWLRRYKEDFKDWQDGNAVQIHGTPIRNWPVVSPAQKENLQRMKVLTVEQLAECNEQVISGLGMGGRALKQQAVDWLKDVKEHGSVNIELTNLRAENERLKGQVDTLSQAVDDLKRMVPQAQAGAEPAASATITANELLDDDKPAAPRKL